MFKKFSKLKKHHQLMYSLLIAVAFVGIWRGLWRLFDIFLFPNNEVLSYSITLILGIIILAVTHHRLG
ncbi:hypothetical protein COV16_02110 [Candidatus Woesearchaeota archaeon CG10_big_fil_rev_8_21_14_0_10_34_8]|nr:MAG: hypothetical protein COV16_02110 [Candidatus Woesearchaeota archaeon CG10_big_fil_rev_8_21_14_0_10_34_8]